MFKRVSLFAISLIIPLFLASCASVERDVGEFEKPAYPPPPEKPRFYWERAFFTSADVKEATAMDKFKAFATGVGAAASGLVKPWGVAAYRGRVYISDTVQRIVAVFDVPGKDFWRIGEDGPGQLLKPIGLAIDRSSGTLYVADNTAKRVVAFDTDGNYLRAFGGRDTFNRPTGVAVSPDGRYLWVIDNGGVDSDNHHLYKFDAVSGELLQTIGQRGKEVGNFNLPMQVATGPDGTVYVNDAGNFRVQAFDSDGNFKSTFGAIGARSGQFSRPKGIATDQDGNVYVVDTTFGNFQIFNSQGQLLLFIGDRSFKGGPGSYVLPAGIAVDEDGRVYVADQYYRRVDVYRPADLPEDQGYLSAQPTKPVARSGK
jgi:DNA-binding beta-propeller fold protein YncE